MLINKNLILLIIFMIISIISAKAQTVCGYNLNQSQWGPPPFLGTLSVTHTQGSGNYNFAVFAGDLINNLTHDPGTEDGFSDNTVKELLIFRYIDWIYSNFQGNFTGSVTVFSSVPCYYCDMCYLEVDPSFTPCCDDPNNSTNTVNYNNKDWIPICWLVQCGVKCCMKVYTVTKDDDHPVFPEVTLTYSYDSSCDCTTPSHTDPKGVIHYCSNPNCPP
jgi:hypothetical protein